mgnify:CR=1 FL=1
MGGFTSGFNPNIFDFAGHRLKKQELRLRERQINQRQGKEGDEMKQSAVRKADIDPTFAEKFMPGQEELFRQLDAFAARYANELNHKNTATDDIEGEFDETLNSIYENMIRQVGHFANHTSGYVTDYKAFHDKVYELDQHLNPIYNRDILEQDDVLLTKEMVEEKMGKDNDGRIIENMDDYSWMWNAEGTAYDDGAGQQTALKVNGEYQYETGPNGEQYLLGTDGKPLVAYGLNDKNELIKAESGNYKFESIYNQEYNPLLLKFNAKGNIVYGEEGNQVAFHDYWSRDFAKLDKNKYSTNGVLEISKGLQFDLIRDEAFGGTNSEITPEAMNNLWDQAYQNSLWNPNQLDEQGNRKGGWVSEYGTIAARMVADEILKQQGNLKPTEGARNEAIRKIQLGYSKDGDGNFLGELPESLKGSSEYAPGRKIETYQDYMNEMILAQWKSRHASVDIKTPTPTGIDNKNLSWDWNSAGVLNTNIELIDGTTTVNAMGGIHTVSKDLPNIDRPWKPTDINILNDYNDVGFQAFDPKMTKILQQGAAQGEISAGTMGYRIIDKTTGQLMSNTKFDKATNSFIFADENSAENAMIVFGFDGFWKAKDPEDVRELYTGDNEGNLNNEERVWLDNIMENSKGIPGFFPINSSLLSTDELKPYKGGFDRLKTIKKVIIENGQRKEIAMVEDSIIDGEWNFPGSMA